MHALTFGIFSDWSVGLGVMGLLKITKNKVSLHYYYFDSLEGWGGGEMHAAIKTDDKKDNFIHIIFT